MGTNCTGLFQDREADCSLKCPSHPQDEALRQHQLGRGAKGNLEEGLQAALPSKAGSVRTAWGIDALCGEHLGRGSCLKTLTVVGVGLEIQKK